MFLRLLMISKLDLYLCSIFSFSQLESDFLPKNSNTLGLLCLSSSEIFFWLPFYSCSSWWEIDWAKLTPSNVASSCCLSQRFPFANCILSPPSASSPPTSRFFAQLDTSPCSSYLSLFSFRYPTLLGALSTLIFQFYSNIWSLNLLPYPS